MDPIVALTTCRTYDDAVRAAGATAIEKTIRRSTWAIMAAPDIYLLVSEWMQIKRIDDAEQDLIDGRARLIGGLREPETMLIVELEGAQSKIDNETGNPIRIIKTGACILSVRNTALTKNVEAHIKLATGRLKLHESLNRRIQAVVWRLNEIRGGGVTCEQARDATIGYMATTDPRLEIALAFPRVWAAHPRPPLDPVTGETLDPRTRRTESESIEHVLPALASEIEQLRSARQRALAAGDFAATTGLSSAIRDIEQREHDDARTAAGRITDEDDAAELARLRREQGA